MHKKSIRFIRWCVVVLACAARAQATIPTKTADRVFLGTHPSRDMRPVQTEVRIHPQLPIIASAGDDHVVRLWSSETGNLLAKLNGHSDWIDTLEFSPDGDLLYSGGKDRTIHVWNVKGRKLARRITTDFAISAIAASSDGRFIVAAGFGKEILRLDAKNFQPFESLAAACSDVHCVAISPDSQKIVCAGRNGRIRVFDIQAGTSSTYQAHRQRIRAVEFDGSNSNFLSVSEDRTIKQWNVLSSQPRRVMRMSCKLMSMKVIAVDLVAVGGSDNTITLCDLRRQKEELRLVGHQGTVASLDYRNGVLLSGAFENSIRAWKIRPSTESWFTKK